MQCNVSERIHSQLQSKTIEIRRTPVKYKWAKAICLLLQTKHSLISQYETERAIWSSIRSRSTKMSRYSKRFQSCKRLWYIDFRVKSNGHTVSLALPILRLLCAHGLCHGKMPSLSWVATCDFKLRFYWTLCMDHNYIQAFMTLLHIILFKIHSRIINWYL